MGPHYVYSNEIILLKFLNRVDDVNAQNIYTFRGLTRNNCRFGHEKTMLYEKIIGVWSFVRNVFTECCLSQIYTVQRI